MLLESLLQSADRFPNKRAAADPYRDLSYKQLVTITTVIGRIVKEATSNERVGLVMPGAAASMAAFHGIMWAGKTVIPLNFLLPSNELKGVLEDSGIDTIVTIKHFEESLKALPVKLLVLENLGLKRKVIMASLWRRPKPPECKPDDTAVILYTSGTDGLPKGVCLSHSNIYENCRTTIEYATFRHEDNFLSTLPMFHVFGMTGLMFLPIHLGASTYYIPRFNATQVVNTIAEENISVFLAIPSMYNAMLRLKSATPEHFRTLKYPVSGGEPLPPAVFDAVKERFDFEIMQGYGLTETSPIVSVNLPWAKKPTTVGRPIPGVSFRTVDDEGNDVGPDEDGEVLIKGHCIMQGYFNKPEATTRAIEPDGWFHTGDMGRLDSDGYLSITGRKKEMIIVGGENVYPREIENVLGRHPAVSESAVVGLADGRRGEIPVAFVTLADDAEITEIALRDFCREHLAGYKVPRQVHIEADLPRGPTGKVLKRKLIEMIEKQTA